MQTQVTEGKQCFFIGGVDILCAADALQVCVFRTHRREVKACGNGIRLFDLSVGRLHIEGSCPEENAFLAVTERCAVLTRFNA